MDASRFTNKARQEFRILDFVALFQWRTDTSISFMLGRWGDTLTFSDGEPHFVGKDTVFNGFGWLDVHHPCEDHIKVRIRAKLSPELMKFELQCDIVQSTFDALAIPRDETYEVDFFTTNDQSAIHQPVDRHGITDRT